MMGGNNFYWNRTPLLDLYLNHENLGKNSETSRSLTEINAKGD